MINFKKLYEENKIFNGLEGFQGEYRILSNFAIHDKLFIKLPWGSEEAKEYYGDNVEALFQASKTYSLPMIKSLAKTNPYRAKSVGRHCKLRPDWEDIKEEVMLFLLKQKYEKIKEFRDTLNSIPKDKYIVEMNKWNDKEWGVSIKDFQGKNKLGRLLTQIRNENKKS